VRLLLAFSLAGMIQAAVITSIDLVSTEADGDYFHVNGSAGLEVFHRQWTSTGLIQWVANSQGQFVLQISENQGGYGYENGLSVGRYGVGDPSLDRLHDFVLSPDLSRCDEPWYECPDIGVGEYQGVRFFITGPWPWDPIGLSESGLVTFRLPVQANLPDAGEAYTDVAASFQLDDLSVSISSARVAQIPEPDVIGLLLVGLLLLRRERSS